jgi:O-antigen ligase
MTARRPADGLALAGLVICGALFTGATFGLAGAQAGLLLATALIGAVAAYLLAWPEAGMVLGIFLLYSGVPAVLVNDQGLPAVAALGVPLMLAIPLASRLAGRQGLVINTGLRWLFVLVVVQIAVTMAAKHQQEAQAKLVTFLVEGVVVYLLVVNIVRTPASLRRAIWAMIGAGAFLASVAILQQLSGHADQRFAGFAQLDSAYFAGTSDVFRAQGPIADANYFAQILLPVAALSLAAIWRGRTPRERLLARAAVAVSVTAIAFTYSRGGALALFGILAGLAFFRYLRPVHMAGIVVLLALVLLFVPGYSDRLGTLAGVARSTEVSNASSSDDLSAASRATENKAALLVFRDHPLLGVGQGGFPLFYQQYAQRVGGEIHTRNPSRLRRTDIQAGLPPEREAHNFFLSIGADMGIAGLLAYCTIIVVTLHQLLRARRRWLVVRPDLEGLATGMLLAVTGYLMAGVFLSLAYERYFWLLLGLAGAAGQVLLRYSADSDDPPPHHLRARPAE